MAAEAITCHPGVLHLAEKYFKCWAAGQQGDIPAERNGCIL